MNTPTSTFSKVLALLLPFAFLGNTVRFKSTKKLLDLPVQVTATGGVTSAEYATLGGSSGAFAAINNGKHTGTISINIIADITEGLSAVLNASGTNGGSGTSSYTAITIQPSGGGARTIFGTITGVTSNPATLIDLNGADNVTFDGLNTGGNSLIIDNNSTGAASTIRLKADATNVTIKKCTIKGALDNAAATILISTATTVGNDNFWIDDCDVTASSTGTPAQGIYFNAVNTDNVKVTNSRISDFYSLTSDMYGVRIGILATGCEITGNSFYQTASRTLPTKDFFCVGANTSANIDNLSIQDNYFGGKAINGGITSAPLILTGSGTLRCIALNIGAANTASIQNNQIKNIDFTTSSSTTSNAMIHLITGSFNCGNVTGNTIGNGVTANIGGTFNGILAGTGTAKIFNISNNIITGLSVDGVFRGISINKTASYTVANNQIFNNTVTSGSNLIGIFMDADPPTAPATSTNLITGNTIYGLTGAGTGNVFGIEYKSGGTTNTFSTNFIYNLTTTGSTYKEFVMGINISATTISPVTFSNNMICIGNNMTRGVTIYGVRDTVAECSYYNNSIFIGGNAVTSSGNTFAYYSGNKTNTRTLKNNIFSNLRTNSSGTGTNYSIQSNNLGTLVIDNNLYYGNTALDSGYKIGKYGSTDYTNFCTWKSALGTTKETNSLFKDPKFINPTASTPDLHLQDTNPAESMGATITSVTTDFDGITRASTPDIGADEGSFTLDPVVSLASLGGPFCSNDAPISLSGGSPSGAGGSFSGTGVSGTTFTPSIAGTFTIGYTFNNNVDICNTATQTITVNAQPTTPSVSNINYCIGATPTALTATGANLKWYSNPSGGTGDANAPTPSTASSTTTSYFVSQSANNCESPRAKIDVIVNEITSPANAGANQTNSTGNFIVTGNTPNAGTGQWSVVNGIANITNTNATSATVKVPSENAPATLCWTITHGACTSTSNTTLTMQTPLPLTLLQFNVKSGSHQAILIWRTTDEKNVKGYDLQRSTNGKEFKSIAWMDAKGNGFYQYEDLDISAGVTYYYRLKMMDNDGRFDISPIKTASFESEGEKPKIYPNPVMDEAYLSCVSATENTVYLRIVNIQGQVIQVFSQKLLEGENTIPLKIWDLPSGFYFMVVETEGRQFRLKISKN